MARCVVRCERCHHAFSRASGSILHRVRSICLRPRPGMLYAAAQTIVLGRAGCDAGRVLIGYARVLRFQR